MKKLLLIAASLFFMPAAFAQSDADMQAWMDYMTPGDMHSMLASYDGTWKEEITHWMAPGAPPVKQESEMTSEMIMDGRYQRSVHRGDFQGMPFIGESVTGYDNARKVFVNTWIDNMGSGIMYSEGAYDPTVKAINYIGSMTDPTSKKVLKVREVHTFVDDNTQKLEMYLTQDGKETKTMEIVFTRQ